MSGFSIEPASCRRRSKGALIGIKRRREQPVLIQRNAGKGRGTRLSLENFTLETAMPFRTILTVTAPELGNGDLKLAEALCEGVGAHLSALVVQMAAPPPVGEFAVIVSDAWFAERQEDERRLEARRIEVTTALASSPVSTDVTAAYQELAWSDEAIGRRARYADLTVVGPELLATETLGPKVVEGALFSSGKPLLLVPEGARATLRPKRVMVAWDARIESSRAVREALEMLVAADEVSVVLVDPVAAEYSHGAEPGADIAAYLARHGAKVRVDRLPGEGQAVAAVLRRHAVDFDADMLVMGAYGHSRLRQRIFGGTTNSMLANPPLALFMAR
jgi:nucleotide-binding universal stress UspA family protein